MGLLKALGKIGSIALDFIPGGAAAKTGVKLAKGIAKGAEAAGDLGSTLGAQQAGAAAGRKTQAELQLAHDRLAQDRYRAEQDAQFSARRQDLDTKAFTNDNRATVGKQALISALLSGKIDPVSVQGGKSSGGLLAALQANPEALAAMKTMHGQASEAQNTPLSFDGGKLLTAPTLTALPQIDKGGFLSTLANIGQLAGAASPYLKPGSGDPGASPAAVGSQPQLAGVTPFTLPPKAKFPVPMEDDDWSNR